MALPVKELDPEVVITPRGRSEITLEGTFDAIYEQLRTIKTDAQLVPHAQYPVDLGGGRCRVEVALSPGPALAVALNEPVTETPKQRRLRMPRWLRRPHLTRDQLVLTAWWGAAVASLGLIGGAVWGAVLAAQVVAAFLSVWLVPVAIVGMAILAAVGFGLERHNAAQAQVAQFNEQLLAAQAAGKPVVVTGHTITAVPAVGSPVPVTTVKTHWFTGKPVSGSITTTSGAGSATDPSTAGPTTSVIHIEETEPATHWFTGRPLNEAAEAQEVHEQQWAALLDPGPRTHNWLGFKTQETKDRERQEKLANLSPLAQQWITDLRDPDNSRRQARGTYADGLGNYCAVGLETHKRGDVTHPQMCREFGTKFVRDVELRNDSTNASFADLANYIEEHCS